MKKIKGKIGAGVLAAIVLLGTTNVFADEVTMFLNREKFALLSEQPQGALETVTLYINNELIVSSPPAMVENGTTLVPLRIVSEKLGCQVKWNEELGQITIVKDDERLVLQIGETAVMLSDGTFMQLPIAPQIVQDTSMVPVRFISEMLNQTVLWDERSQSVFINSPSAYAEVCEQTLPDTTSAPAASEDPAIDTAIAAALQQYQDGMLYESLAAAENILTLPAISDKQIQETEALIHVIQDAIVAYEDSFNVKAVVYIANVENSVNFRTAPRMDAAVICTIPFSHAVGWISNGHNGFTRVE